MLVSRSAWSAARILGGLPEAESLAWATVVTPEASDVACPCRPRIRVPPTAAASRCIPQTNITSARGNSEADSFFLRGFRARGFPPVPALPSSLLDGKEGVDGSSPSEGSFSKDEAAANRGIFVAAADTVEHLLRREVLH